MSLATVRLGDSDLDITRVGVGTAPIGSTPDWRINWGPQSEADAIRAIEAAIDLGVNWIDTAPFYGWGRAEQIVGKALRGKRERVHIFTKCGTVRDEQGNESENLAPANMRREIEASLRNLQTDYVDLYQFHDPDPRTPIEESWAAMQALIQEGKVRYGGLSNHPVDLMERAMAVAPVVSSQNQYHLLHRAIERDVLPFAAKHHIGMLAWSPLASGFLVEEFDLARLDPMDFRLGRPFAQEPAWSLLQQLRAELIAIAHGHNKRLEELAIAWILRQPSMTGAIMGVRNEPEARAMTGGLDWTLSEDEVGTIERILAAWDAGIRSVTS